MPDKTTRPVSVKVRQASYRAKFMARVEQTATCWNWTAAKYQNGYGHVWAFGADLLAHRVSYMMNVGNIPPNTLVLHHCDNKACVRPDHLFLGNKSSNKLDADSKGRIVYVNSKKQFCKHGHRFDEANTRITIRDRNGKLRRTCRQCDNIRRRRERSK